MNDEDRVIKVVLSFEWRMGPLWVSFDDGDVPTSYFADEVTEVLPLSGELVAAITEWDERLQRTFVSEQPQDSGFNDPEEYRKFNADGRELALRLKREVDPGITVVYDPGGDADEVIEV